MKIFYHNDADGKCAASVLHQKYGSEGTQYISMDYHQRVPLEIVEADEVVCIVDFSFSVEDMEILVKRTPHVIWIDHHVSAIEKLDDFCDVEGLRSVDYSGAELTWLYLHLGIQGHNVAISKHSRQQCPEHIRLIGDRDVWRWEYGERTRYFHAYISFAGFPEPDDVFWYQVPGNLNDYVAKGQMLDEHMRSIYKSFADAFAYEALFEGHTILVCNSPISGSDIFGDRYQQYPFVGVYCHDGQNWKVSLYSSKMDVVEFAKARGGGGHPRACGFTSTIVPFEKKSQK